MEPINCLAEILANTIQGVVVNIERKGALCIAQCRLYKSTSLGSVN